MTSLLIASCLFLIIGFLCAIAGAVLNYYVKQNEIYKNHVEARVVEIVNEPRSEDAPVSEFHNMQVAIFQYLAEGKIIKVRDKSDTYPCPYTMNQKVKLCYLPGSPEDYILEPKNPLQQSASWLHRAGVTFALIGVLFFFMHAARVEL